MTYPDIEVEILVCDGFDVEANRGYCCNDFTNLALFSNVMPALEHAVAPLACTAVSSCRHYPTTASVILNSQSGSLLLTRPSIRMRISFFDHSRPMSLENERPMLRCLRFVQRLARKLKGVQGGVR